MLSRVSCLAGVPAKPVFIGSIPIGASILHNGSRHRRDAVAAEDDRIVGQARRDDGPDERADFEERTFRRRTPPVLATG